MIDSRPAPVPSAPIVLKRGLQLFLAFVCLVAAAIVFAYVLDRWRGFGSGVSYAVFELLVAPHLAVERWIYGAPPATEPILFRHLFVGLDGLGLLLLAYFLLCLALAWVWTRMTARPSRAPSAAGHDN